MDYDGKINAYNYQQNKYTQQQSKPDFLITNCNGNIDLDVKANANNLDMFFNQETPYKFPPLIICDDSKRLNQSQDIYKKYMDIITDDCGNRFNIHNISSSAGILQAGYSANIDLDSHLKNINYYNDKCYYDNWKISPNNASVNVNTNGNVNDTPTCNGIKRNAKLLTPDYTAVGKNSVSINANANANANAKGLKDLKDDTNDDTNDDYNIRKRYDFSHNKFQTESCIKPNEWKSFVKAPAPPIKPLEKYPNGIRNQYLMDTINQGTQHDFYKFFDIYSNYQCTSYPNQRLFNNITKRSMLPNQHFRDINPIYAK